MALPIGLLRRYCHVKMKEKKSQGTHGFEPWTYRIAANCSITELYPHFTDKDHCLALDICTPDVDFALYAFSWMGFTSTLDLPVLLL